MKKLEAIDGETLMSKPLQPLNFVVDTLISQGLHVLAGLPKVEKSCWVSGQKAGNVSVRRCRTARFGVSPMPPSIEQRRRKN